MEGPTQAPNNGFWDPFDRAARGLSAPNIKICKSVAGIRWAAQPTNSHRYLSAEIASLCFLHQLPGPSIESTSITAPPLIVAMLTTQSANSLEIRRCSLVGNRWFLHRCESSPTSIPGNPVLSPVIGESNPVMWAIFVKGRSIFYSLRGFHSDQGYLAPTFLPPLNPWMLV